MKSHRLRKTRSGPKEAMAEGYPWGMAISRVVRATAVAVRYR